MQLLRRQQRKSGGEIEAELMTEDAARAGAGAIGFLRAVIEDVADEREVLLHKPLDYRATAPTEGPYVVLGYASQRTGPWPGKLLRR
jgi:hypothetical protein